MWLARQSLRVVARSMLLFAILATPTLASPVASAQTVPNPSAVAPLARVAAVAPAAPQGPASPRVLKQLGIQRPAAKDLTALSQQIATQVRMHGLPASTGGPQQPSAGGLIEDLSPGDAQSASILTTLNGANGSNFRDVTLLANADGTEDGFADHAYKVDDLSTANLPSGWMLTRAATSEHTVANGYTETVYYYGDSVGNVYVTADSSTNTGSHVLTETVLNLPTILNAFGGLDSDHQIVVTGLGVNPVADLSSFANVNGSFASFAGKVGEILYVSFWDTSGGFRYFNTGQIIQSGVLAFPIADLTSPVAAPAGIQSNLGFPVTVGGAFGVAFSTFANVAGLAVDDDGSVYFQQVDLTNFTGANIVKITSVDKPGLGGFQDRSLATSGFLTTNDLNPVNGFYGTVSGPQKQVSLITNFAGTSPTFGNIAALATGPNNVLYAAVARSLVASDSAAVQATEGLFANPAALGPTPSMVVSFADTSGAFSQCSVPANGAQGTLPIADNFADVAQAGLTLQPGVNNFRAFVLGDGPDARSRLVGATPANTPQIDFQVDDTIYSGLAVDQESKVYVISGATPAGVGLNPSPSRGEILAFPDQQLFDRRADFIDQRGLTVPVPSEDTNLGDNQVTRFDYLYLEAPLEQASLTPVGLSGLASGFLLYLNRTRTDPARFLNLPNGHTQADDATDGPIFFEEFDAGSATVLGHQIAGGDDQHYPFHGDDDGGAGSPALLGVLNGGFEFNYRQFISATLQPTAWNAFYLNSNGNLSFGVGDASPTPTVASLLTGAPRLAGAWTNLDPGSAWQHSFDNTFPVQALGFANINHFIVRWINVPSAGFEKCNSSNSMAIGLYDDGTGVDENANQPFNPANPIGNNAVPFNLQEGPTDLHYVQDVNNLAPAGYNPRPDHSGNLCYTYGRMDLLGSQAAGDQVLVGAAPGLLAITSLPGLNISNVALTHDLAFPAPLGVAIGTSAPAAPYQFFTAGTANTFITSTVGVSPTTIVTTTVAGTPAFDLRQEGNDPALGTPVHQSDANRGQVCFYNQATQTITFGPLANQTLSTPPQTVPVSLTATASSGLPVSFVSLTPDVCTVAGVQVVLHLTGQCIIRAEQTGNEFFSPATDVDRAFQVLLGVYLTPVTR